jgi:hypothetical protein
MKNQKKYLNEELNRIREIMGVKKNLLMEQSFIDDFIQGIIVAGEKRGVKQAAEEFVNKLENASTPKAKAEIIDDFWKKSDVLMRNEIDILMRSKFTDQVRKQIDDIAVAKDTDDFMRAAIDRGSDDESILKMMADDFPPNTGDDIMDELAKKKLRDSLRTKLDKIRKDADDVIEPKPKPADDVVDDVVPETVIDDVVDNIPETEYKKIWDISNWDSVPLPSNLPKLLDPNFLDDFFDKLKNMWAPKKSKIQKIQRIAKQLESYKKEGKEVELQAKLEDRLKKELEWLYRNSTNYFVYIRKYFDDVAKVNKDWRDAWQSIKSGDSEWEFYKTFGKVAEYMPVFKRFWGSLTTDLKLMFESDIIRSYKIVNWVSRKKILTVPEAKTSFLKNIQTGSRRGFPTMTNEYYKDIIIKYGLRGAKTVYYRDLITNFFKWHVYVGFLITVKNAAAYVWMNPDVQACIKSNDTNSEACKKINNSRLYRLVADYSMDYSPSNIPQETGGFFGGWWRQINPFGSENLPDVSDENTKAKNATEIWKLSPGMIGDISNLVVGVIDNLDLNKKSTFEKQIDEMIAQGEEKLKEAAEKLSKANESMRKSWSENWTEAEMKVNEKILKEFFDYLASMDPPRSYGEDSYFPMMNGNPPYAMDSEGVVYKYENLRWVKKEEESNNQTTPTIPKKPGDVDDFKSYLSTIGKTYEEGTHQVYDNIPYGEDSDGHGYQYKDNIWDIMK